MSVPSTKKVTMITAIDLAPLSLIFFVLNPFIYNKNKSLQFSLHQKAASHLSLHNQSNCESHMGIVV